MKDYYSVLGVSEDATQDQIKSAYKKLALQHHTDTGSGNEDRMKEINEAYNTLKTPEKRAEYDNERKYGGDPFGGFGGGNNNNFHNMRFYSTTTDDIGDIFQHWFHKVPNTEKRLSISLEDAFNGKSLDLTTPKGKKRITIPAGARDRSVFRLQGAGTPSNNQRVPDGDLIVHLHILPHPRFRVNGDSLVSVLPLNISDLLLGTTVDFETICGKKLKVNVKECSAPGSKLKLDGYGMPTGKRRGPLILELQARMPDSLTDEQKEHIGKLRENGL